MRFGTEPMCPSITQHAQIGASAEFMVTGDDGHLPTIVRHPASERCFLLFVAEVMTVPGDNEHVVRNLQRMFLPIA